MEATHENKLYPLVKRKLVISIVIIVLLALVTLYLFVFYNGPHEFILRIGVGQSFAIGLLFFTIYMQYTPLPLQVSDTFTVDEFGIKLKYRSDAFRKRIRTEHKWRTIEGIDSHVKGRKGQKLKRHQIQLVEGGVGYAHYIHEEQHRILIDAYNEYVRTHQENLARLDHKMDVLQGQVEEYLERKGG